MQRNLLIYWRFPPDPDAKKDDRFKEDAEILRLKDEAMFGKLQKPKNPYANLEGYDFVDIPDEADE